ncbi:MAG: tRNA 2-thiocytidine biosynthesis TtcA family protein [Spirochaetia bacterium]|jgi:tRNA 2-thiocytidine biosynthesis protein TtcA
MKDRPRADALLLERFSRHAGRGINRFEMIGPGDRILIGVSGGKDSLALSLALQERRKWVPIDYELFAVQVEWREYPMTDEEKAAIDGFFDGIGIPLRRIQAQIAPPTFGKKFSCYTCARNRKRILFDEATRIDARKIALGHHMDDIARTTLMNMFFHGELSTMMPVQHFFGGKLSIIRPLCEIRESEVSRLAARLDLPSAPNRCPRADKNRRLLMKEILRQASHVDRHAVSNVYGAAWRVNSEYLPLPSSARTAPPDCKDESGAADAAEEDNADTRLPEAWL